MTSELDTDRRMEVSAIPGSNCCKVVIGRRGELVVGSVGQILSIIEPIARQPAPMIWRALGIVTP